MKTKPPPGQRKFAGPREQLEYLYHKLLYWLYERQDRARSTAFAERLARALRQTAVGNESIFAEDCWSLVEEAKGNLRGAIKHRENEIQLIKRLQELALTSPMREELLALYGYDQLSDRLDVLAALYHDRGNLDQAIDTLRESKAVCRRHRVTFDGQEMLDAFLAEKDRASTNGKGARAPHGAART